MRREGLSSFCFALRRTPGVNGKVPRRGSNRSMWASKLSQPSQGGRGKAGLAKHGSRPRHAPLFLSAMVASDDANGSTTVNRSDDVPRKVRGSSEASSFHHVPPPARAAQEPSGATADVHRPILIRGQSRDTNLMGCALFRDTIGTPVLRPAPWNKIVRLSRLYYRLLRRIFPSVENIPIHNP